MNGSAAILMSYFVLLAMFGCQCWDSDHKTNDRKQELDDLKDPLQNQIQLPVESLCRVQDCNVYEAEMMGHSCSDCTNANRRKADIGIAKGREGNSTTCTQPRQSESEKDCLTCSWRGPGKQSPF